MKIKKTASAVLVLLALSGAAVGGDRQDVAERRARGFIDALNDGSVDEVLAFMGDNFTPETLGKRPETGWRMIFGRVTEDLGAIETQSIEIDGDRMIVEARSRRGPVEFRFGIGEAEPYRLAGFEIELGQPGGHGRRPQLPSPALERGMDVEAIAEALNDYFTLLESEHGFSGTIAIARDGEVIFEAARGKASLRYDVPNTLDMRFDIGSIGKVFTRVAIGRLVYEGKLDFDDTLLEVLPEYPNVEVAKRITVRQLLDHTSGLGNIFTEKFFRSSKTLYRSPADFFPLFADEPLLFEPGTSKSYSNAGYEVLGAVVEKVAEVPYDEYIAEHVFGPAGMTNSGMFARDQPVPDVAIGYTRMTPEGQGEILRNNHFRLPVESSPAGSAYCTAEDLIRFDWALRTYRLLAPGWAHWVVGGPEPEGPGSVEPEDRVRLAAAFGGGAPGVSALLEGNGEVTVVVLSNFNEPGVGAVMRSLRGPLTEALERPES